MSANHSTKRSASASRPGRSVTSAPFTTGPNMAAQNTDNTHRRSRMELAFLGAATTVTGSQFLLTTDRARVLVDCGMFQGSPNEVTRNRLPFAFPPREVDALLLTHAHLDHCGLIPALVADGFAGPIYATAGTVELAGLVLLGDIGGRGTPLVRDPTVVSAADYVLMESTYGGREHEPYATSAEVLAETCAPLASRAACSSCRRSRSDGRRTWSTSSTGS